MFVFLYWFLGRWALASRHLRSGRSSECLLGSALRDVLKLPLLTYRPSYLKASCSATWSVEASPASTATSRTDARSPPSTGSSRGPLEHPGKSSGPGLPDWEQVVAT